MAWSGTRNVRISHTPGRNREGPPFASFVDGEVIYIAEENYEILLNPAVVEAVKRAIKKQEAEENDSHRDCEICHPVVG